MATTPSRSTPPDQAIRGAARDRVRPGGVAACGPQGRVSWRRPRGAGVGGLLARNTPATSARRAVRTSEAVDRASSSSADRHLAAETRSSKPSLKRPSSRVWITKVSASPSSARRSTDVGLRIAPLAPDATAAELERDAADHESHRPLTPRPARRHRKRPPADPSAGAFVGRDLRREVAELIRIGRSTILTSSLATGCRIPMRAEVGARQVLLDPG